MLSCDRDTEHLVERQEYRTASDQTHQLGLCQLVLYKTQMNFYYYCSLPFFLFKRKMKRPKL